MSSILTNNSAMNALTTLRNINNSLDSTQNRISTGLKVNSGKDNAAYFQISESMKGDSSALSSINEGLTLTKNSIETARVGAETINTLSKEFVDKIAFAQGAKGGETDIQNDLNELVKRMEATLAQSTFNGDDLLGASSYSAATGADLATDGTFTSKDTGTSASTNKNVVTGISRAGDFTATTMEVEGHNMAQHIANFKEIATDFTTGEAFLKAVLETAETTSGEVADIATKLGQSSASVEGQQEFLNKLTDNLDAGVGAMIDANMEEEAARLQALQVQQQLATQSLTMANQKPQNILSLFR
ncbi:flagellin family protein [Roseivivax halodurans JCM 10272]|uniref:Flagellin n=1 Tax=Roseivivax halodurans JCM 10272 TaxID=1449350 RepID=X7EMB7_9RHOB|nr:flagellin [Roseivivax halodurans]ETX16311.1 flagellin family protein [Roseivivax halodurans JCM 10272]